MIAVRVLSEIIDGGKRLRAGTIGFEGFIATKLPYRTKSFTLMWHYYLKVRNQFMEDVM